MKSLLFALCALTGLASSPVQAAEGRWTHGFGQGNHEFFVDQGNLRLYVSCLTSEDAASSITLLDIPTGREVTQFKVKVGQQTWDGPVQGGSRVGADNYFSLLEALRKGPATVSFAGKTVAFSATGAAQAIPAGRKATMCRAF